MIARGVRFGLMMMAAILIAAPMGGGVAFAASIALCSVLFLITEAIRSFTKAKSFIEGKQAGQTILSAPNQLYQFMAFSMAELVVAVSYALTATYILIQTGAVDADRLLEKINTAYGAFIPNINVLVGLGTHSPPLNNYYNYINLSVVDLILFISIFYICVLKIIDVITLHSEGLARHVTRAEFDDMVNDRRSKAGMYLSPLLPVGFILYIVVDFLNCGNCVSFIGLSKSTYLEDNPIHYSSYISSSIFYYVIGPISIIGGGYSSVLLAASRLLSSGDGEGTNGSQVA